MKSKWLIKGHSESNMLDIKFEKGVTRSQSCIVNFVVMAKVTTMDEPNIYVDTSKGNETMEA